jgi:hypothetical protein
MLLPAITIEIDNVSGSWMHWSSTILAGMTPMLIVVDLILPELVLQVSRRPEEGVIQ